MKNFIKIYILISFAVFIFSVYGIFVGLGGLMHKTQLQYYTIEQLEDTQKSDYEYIKENFEEVLKKNIVNSCIYGGYAILSVVLGILFYLNQRSLIRFRNSNIGVRE